MCGLILLIVIGLPIAELWLLIEVGGRIGSFETIFLVFLSAALGLYAVRGQSMGTVARLKAGGGPAEAAMLEGPLLALAALMLLLPGFITDTAGALLLVPPIRRLVARRWSARKRARAAAQGQAPNAPGAPPGPAPVIVLTRWDSSTRDPSAPAPADAPNADAPNAHAPEGQPLDRKDD
jgi:UPF0716 protein FxsA